MKINFHAGYINWKHTHTHTVWDEDEGWGGGGGGALQLKLRIFTRSVYINTSLLMFNI